AYGAAADGEGLGDLLEREVVVVAGDDDGALAFRKLPERDEQVRALDREVDVVARDPERLHGDVRQPAAPVTEQHARRDDQEPGPRTIERREALLECAHERLLDRVLGGTFV